MRGSNYLLTISFLGTNYHGSQIQKNAVTVQEVLQNALYQVLGEKTDVKFCSRTDSGVHAFMFCLSFNSVKVLSERSFLPQINNILPTDIRAYSLKKVDDDFHARYSSKGKKYEYYIWAGSTMSPFWEGRAFFWHNPVNLDLIKDAASVLIGTHDFSSFSSRKSSVDDKIRTIYDISVTCKDDNLYIISITADGFLYNMARIIVGSLLQVSKGKLTCSDLKNYLDGKSRDNLLPTLPACGLYLREVYY